MPLRLCWLLLFFCSMTRAEVGVSVLAAYRFGDDLAVRDGNVGVDEGGSGALTVHYFDSASTAFDLWLSTFSSDAHDDETERSVEQESIQFGGRKYWHDAPFYPYVGATVGVIRLTPDLQQRERETRPAFTLFTGLALPLGEQTQLLAEARWLGTVFSSETRLRCDDNDCEWTIKSGTWSQYEIGVGISAHF